MRFYDVRLHIVVRALRPRNDAARHFFAAAARSTKVLPPFILWISGASLIWITTLSASTPRFFTSAWVISRIMPTFCSSVRPAAMLIVISGIFHFSPCLTPQPFDAVLPLARFANPPLDGHAGQARVSRV